MRCKTQPQFDLSIPIAKSISQNFSAINPPKREFFKNLQSKKDGILI